MLVDSHCHLPFLPPELGTLEDVHARARAQGVHGMLSIATSPGELAAMQRACAQLSDVWFAAGLHPEAVDPATAGDLARLESSLREVAAAGVVALGETGLDYSPAASAEHHALQRDAFALHLELARRFDLPVIVHTRQAVADTLDLLRAHRGVRGVIHCFTEDQAAADAFVGLGFMISFSGILTFRNAAPLRDVAARVDPDHVLVETDAPFLAPVPVRGKPNQPAWVAHTAACLGTLTGEAPGQVAERTTRNFARLFGVTPGA